MNGKLVLITGGNTGIGKETAAGLAALGAKVLMACRSRERADAAIKELVGRGLPASLLEFVPLNLASLQTIRDTATHLKSTLACPIDVLILNAGFVTPTDDKTDDGFEAMFGVNHLGHFYLSNLLLHNDLIAPQARIVVLSSMAAERGKMALDAIRGYGNSGLTSGFQGYCNTKLYNVLFASELQQRLRQRGSAIDVFALHPGLVRSEFAAPERIGTGIMAGLFRLFARVFAISVTDGAKTSIFAAAAPELTGRGYCYLEKSGISKLKNPLAYNTEHMRALWDLSDQLCGGDYSLTAAAAADTSSAGAAAAAAAAAAAEVVAPVVVGSAASVAVSQ